MAKDLPPIYLDTRPVCPIPKSAKVGDVVVLRNGQRRYIADIRKTFVSFNCRSPRGMAYDGSSVAPNNFSRYECVGFIHADDEVESTDTWAVLVQGSPEDPDGYEISVIHKDYDLGYRSFGWFAPGKKYHVASQSAPCKRPDVVAFKIAMKHAHAMAYGLNLANSPQANSKVKS